MTAFQDQLAADASAVFLNPSEFGEEGVYAFADGDTKTVRAIRRVGDAIDPSGYGPAPSAVCRLRLLVADVPKPAEGDTYTDPGGDVWLIVRPISGDEATWLVEAAREVRAELRAELRR